MQIYLNTSEISVLRRPVSGYGGFQSLLRRLTNHTDFATGQLNLSADDLEKLARYVFDYGNGGWESRLVAVFGRHLGTKLGR